MNLERIANKYPSEREAIARLEELFAKEKGARAEYTLNSLCDAVQPKSREGLALALGELVQQGELKRVIRVVSPTSQGGIGDYSSLDEVPPCIHDWRTDLGIEVRPEDLRVIYVAEAPAEA